MASCHCPPFSELKQVPLRIGCSFLKRESSSRRYITDSIQLNYLGKSKIKKLTVVWLEVSSTSEKYTNFMLSVWKWPDLLLISLDPCPAGAFKDSSMMKCQQCPENSFSVESAGLCTPCPPGSLANPDQTNCGKSFRSLKIILVLITKILFKFKGNFSQKMWFIELISICSFVWKSAFKLEGHDDGATVSACTWD